MTVRLRLRELREARDWQKHEAAARCGLPASNYGEYENGKVQRINFSTLRKLARGFGVHARELIEDDGTDTDAPPG